jgi:hypothetical protein
MEVAIFISPLTDRSQHDHPSLCRSEALARGDERKGDLLEVLLDAQVIHSSSKRGLMQATFANTLDGTLRPAHPSDGMLH